MNSLPKQNLEPEKWLIAQNNEARQLLNNPLLQKDIWRTFEDLGLKSNEHARILTINFKSIEQDWLKLLTKLYTIIRRNRNISIQHIQTDINNLRKFSQFIEKKSIFSSEQINNFLFDEYAYHLNSLKLSPQTISHHYTSLTNFFNICRQEGWLDVNTYWFKGKQKRSSPSNENIEYIPEEVWQQLDQHLHFLYDPMQRMVLIIRATGLRIGELLNLPLDCLRQRGEQWRLRFLTEKYQTEDELPVCPEIVAVIQEQQTFIKDIFGDGYNNLFGTHGCNVPYQPVAKIMQIRTFGDCLNKLAKKQNIRTDEGKIWYFKSHQFRRTVATVMTNAGVRDLIIQKYLRHRSPDMQNHYKHLLKQVLADEYQELMKDTKYVDSTGKLVATHKPQNVVTELVRRRMYQITTQYGECHRPNIKDICQTVNACLRCEHWRTSSEDLPLLQHDLIRIESELEIATKLGMVRQEKGLASDQKNLITRIKGLEEIKDGN